MDVDVEGELAALVARVGAGQHLAHVAGAAGEGEQAGLAVEGAPDLVGTRLP